MNQYDEQKSSHSSGDDIIGILALFQKTILQQMADNRADSMTRHNELLELFKKEIPAGHGDYHKKLIESAAKIEARKEAVIQKALLGGVGGILSLVAIYFHDTWIALVGHFK